VSDRAPLEISIEAIAAGGEGVGHLSDGRVVFVPRTAPGDRVRAHLVKESRSWTRARLDAVVTPGAERREAACELYERCGGCALQHLDYDAQLAAKAAVVRDALTRIGGIELAETPDVEAASAEFGYRNRLSFTLKRLPGRQTRVVAGFHALHQPGHIVEVHGECLLAPPELLEVWQRLRGAWGEGARRLPAGRELRLTLRLVEEGVVLLVEGGGGPGAPEALLDAVDGLVGIWHRPEAARQGNVSGGSARSSAPRPVAPRHVAGLREVHDLWLGTRIALEGSTFLQVNRDMAERLHRYVLDELGDCTNLHVVDAYCGVGLYGRHLAEQGAKATGIELENTAAKQAQRHSPDGFSVLNESVERALSDLLPADRLILNPPRGGLDEGIPELLRTYPASRIVYVSCDPATLARDLKRLGDAYALRRVRAFDLFPQTAHVETVVTLEAVPPSERTICEPETAV